MSLLVLTCLPGISQKIDSLNRLLSGKVGIDHANLLYELAYEYVDVDNRLAKKYAMQAFSMAKEYGDSLLLVKSGRIGALALARLEMGDSSVSLSRQILPIARRNNYTPEIEHILNRLGSAYTYKGSYDSALIYYFESLEHRVKSGDKLKVSVALNNTGVVYYNIENFDKALSFYLQALDLKEQGPKNLDYNLLLTNISSCYAFKGDLLNARRFVERAITACGNGCPEEYLMAINFSLGLISYETGEYENARHKFSQSYDIAKSLGRSQFKLDNIFHLLKIVALQNQAPKRELLNEAESLLQGNIYYPVSLIGIYQQLFEGYGRLEDSQKKSLYQAKYIQLKDSIYNSQLTLNLMKIEADHIGRENREKIEAQKKILELNNVIITRQRTLNFITAVVAFLSVGFVVLLSLNLKQKRLANVLLENKVRERTRELEENHIKLMKSLKERDLESQRLSNEIRSSLATIKGLGTLVSNDEGIEHVSTYLTRIEETANKLISGLNRSQDTRTS